MPPPSSYCMAMYRYPSLSKMIFDAHACRRLAEGVHVLRADTRVDCAADSFIMIRLVGWLMGLCWIFGVFLV